MAKREPRSIKMHHILFLAGCVGLTLTTVWAFYNDYFQREYPKYQEVFNQVEIERLEAEKQKAIGEWQDLNAESQDITKKIDEIEKEIKKNERDLRVEREDVRKINDDLALLRRKLNFAGTDTGVINWDWQSAKEADKAKAYERVLQHAAYTRGLFDEVLGKEAEAAKHQAVVNQFEDRLKDANKRKAAFDGHLKEVLTALYKAKGIPALNYIKDAPGIDFIEPRANLNDQIVLPNLPVDVLFASTQRVDRCVVCHKGIDNTDATYRTLDGDKKVLRSHPRLDLYVSPNSKHPMKVFGCTICHQGRGMGVSFLRAAHTPRNEAQGEQWKKDYGWDTLDKHAPGQPLWDYPMLPMQYVEASCAKCHKGVDNVPGAAKLNKGREIFRERGCVNCHVGTTDADLAWMGRIGPDLRRIGEKTEAQWAQSWIENPTKFRADTRMPRIFGLENRKDLVNGNWTPEELAQVSYDSSANAKPTDTRHPREPVEIEAITTYLFATSKLREEKLPDPPKGDAEKGEKVFEQVGCLACHSTRTAKDKYTFNNHGPDLSRIGEKVKPAWLFQWLKNPKHYWAETRMPSLRLSDEEAANLSAFLLKEMKDPNAKAPKHEEAPAWAYDALIRDLLLNNTPDFRIVEMLGDADALVRDELKKKVKYGTKPGETQKLDLGTGEWTEPQIDALVKVLDGMGADKAAKDRVKKVFYSGATLIQNYGCFACHNIQGWTNAPLSCVNLNGEGDKDVAKFAFGNTHIPHTRWDWIYLKIARPRIYDEGALEITRPLDRLRMPWFGYKKDSAPGSEGPSAGETPSKTVQGASGGEAHAHATSSIETAKQNGDVDEGFGLSHEDIEALVTVVLSYTNEPIPLDMKKKPTPKDIAVNAGERVIHSLHCFGCHLIGMDKPVTQVDPISGRFDEAKQGRVALAALLTRKAQIAAKNMGLFSDRDEFSLNHAGAAGFLNFGRGTYLSEVTLPMLLAEMNVRRSASEALEPLGLRFLKERDFKKIKKGQERWTTYGNLVSQAKFVGLTRFFFADKSEEAQKAYEENKVLYVNVDAYERMAGTEALRNAEKDSGFQLSERDLRDRVAAGSAWPGIELEVRWTHGEGLLVPYIVQKEGSQQQAPPSLSFEGGKVQPDWFYGFLRNVQPLRPTLNIRMPSFWAEGPTSSYKQVYPSGRASAVLGDLRPTGVNGEPAPGPDSLTSTPDDTLQIVEYFNAIGEQKPYGFQPVPVMTAENRKTYQLGYQLLFPADAKLNPGGVSCTSCHSIGALETAAPKGPNLATAKRRFKDEWLLRFLTFPQGIYPWANMPANFYDWTSYEYTPDDPLRGMGKGEEKEFKSLTDRIGAIKFYLLTSGEDEVGKTPGPTLPAAAPPAKQP
ncbi:MAG: c-type cytochrome [Planctomycetes bacterium]|nr:c-type cytochrome [Planctomycetota bacterium]